ncbi:hypothetical protein [Candidatus Nitrotoga sp. M5]|nr:hypothetical protein [Candidatus Nitrotoga sp. M5]
MSGDENSTGIIQHHILYRVMLAVSLATGAMNMTGEGDQQVVFQ